PIVVTLLLPKDAMAVNLKSCRFEYDDDSGGKVVTRGGDVSPAFTQGGTWEVRLPLEVSGKPTRLRLRDDQGGAWQVLQQFFPNYTQQTLSKDAAAPASSPTGSWAPIGVAVLEAAESEIAQQQANLRFNNYARPIAAQNGRSQYEWQVFVDEPPQVLNT